MEWNRRTWMLLATLVAGIGASVHAQTSDPTDAAGGPFSRHLVLNAPFSAEATTRIQRVLPDGTTRVDTLTARYYRDSLGRVRAELDTQWGPYVIVEAPVEVPAPHVAYYAVNPQKGTYQPGAGYYYASELFNGEGRPRIPLGKACFEYPLPAVAGASGDERLQAVHAQVATDLGIVTASHRADGIVTVDYRVTNIRRDEPSPRLFDVADLRLTQGPHDPVITIAPGNRTSCNTHLAQ